MNSDQFELTNMKCVILAGGYGTRISEESHLKPKPMIEVGGKPILWHIMKIYSAHKINDFVICLGYKGDKIKEYFSKFDSTSWNIQLVDTGEDTMTGGRLKRIQDHIDDTFCVTYGDGLSDVDISSLIQFHNEKKKMVTLTAVQPPGRFGSLLLDDTNVQSFIEKPKGDNTWINGGFFVSDTDIFDLIEDDSTIFEKHTLPTLAKQNHVNAFKHDGFWQPMDTLRDKNYLEDLWSSGNVPWKSW